MFVCRRAGIIFVQEGPFSLPPDYADTEISHGRPSQTAGFVATASGIRERRFDAADGLDDSIYHIQIDIFHFETLPLFAEATTKFV